MPASPSPPLPRARRSKNVSAWSSRWWARSRSRTSWRRHHAVSSRYLASRAAAWMPLCGAGPSRRSTAWARPCTASQRPTRAASAAESGRNPWSTVSAVIRVCPGRAQSCKSSARARESGPPDTATASRRAGASGARAVANSAARTGRSAIWSARDLSRNPNVVNEIPMWSSWQCSSNDPTEPYHVGRAEAPRTLRAAGQPPGR